MTSDSDELNDITSEEEIKMEEHSKGAPEMIPASASKVGEDEVGQDHAYYRELLEKGYTEAEAIRHTTSYYPNFDPLGSALPDPLPPSGWVDPEAPSPTAVAVQNAVVSAKEYSLIAASKASVAYSSLGGKWKEVRSSVERNQTAYIAGLSVLALLALGVLSSTLVQPTHPLDGTWLAADGQVRSIEADGGWNAPGSINAVWEIEGDELNVRGYTNSYQPYEQTMRVALTEDGSALWMKWTSLSIDGNVLTEEQLPQTCALFLHSSLDGAASNHATASLPYSEAAPSWC